MIFTQLIQTNLRTKELGKKVEYYNCMSELLLLLKNTFRELTDIYNKYVLIPKLKNSI